MRLRTNGEASAEHSPIRGWSRKFSYLYPGSGGQEEGSESEPEHVLARKDSGIRQDEGVVILSVTKRSRTMVFNPSPDPLLAPEDRFMAVGEPGQRKRLEGRATRQRTENAVTPAGS